MNSETKIYQVFSSLINFTIYLDTEGKFKSVQIGNENPSHRVSFEDEDWKILKRALKFLFIEEPEKFKELYTTLKENDPEIFKYVNSVVESIEEYCKNLIS